MYPFYKNITIQHSKLAFIRTNCELLLVSFINNTVNTFNFNTIGQFTLLTDIKDYNTQ